MMSELEYQELNDEGDTGELFETDTPEVEEKKASLSKRSGKDIINQLPPVEKKKARRPPTEAQLEARRKNAQKARETKLKKLREKKVVVTPPTPAQPQPQDESDSEEEYVVTKRKPLKLKERKQVTQPKPLSEVSEVSEPQNPMNIFMEMFKKLDTRFEDLEKKVTTKKKKATQPQNIFNLVPQQPATAPAPAPKQNEGYDLSKHMFGQLTQNN